MSGDKTFRYYLDNFIYKFQNAGFEVQIFRSAEKGELAAALRDVDSESYSAIVVSGGDGSVNEVVNGMMHYGIDVPLGIIPSGTANDFAIHLNLPSDIDACCDTILRGNVKRVDLGSANGRYFINVCSGGLLTNVSQNIDIHFKNTLGKLAYYLKGIEQLPSFRPIPLQITTKNQVLKEDVYLFLVLNGSSAGGFDKLAKNALVNDGLFDILLIKAKPLHELAVLFIKILRGEHLTDSNILFLREEYLKIESLDQDTSFAESDLDGERGPDLPLEIKIHPKAIAVFANI